MRERRTTVRQLATKDDLERQGGEVRGEIKQLGTELRGEMKAMEERLTRKMYAVAFVAVSILVAVNFFT